MRTDDFPSLQSTRGFTLVELMIVTVVLGIITMVATPFFITYRDKSRVASGLGTAHAIQAALSSYTTTSTSNLYPATITSYGELLAVVNANGATLKSTEQEVGLQFQTYGVIDSDGNGEHDSYTMNLRVIGVATERRRVG